MNLRVTIEQASKSSWLESAASWANVGVGLLALFVAGISIYVSVKALKNQENHNKLSVRPIAYFRLGDYENRIIVAIKNNGVGPLLVGNFSASKGGEVFADLISIMPESPDPFFWAHFSSKLVDRSVLPGEEIILLDLRGEPKLKKFATYRDKCREVLADVAMQLSYTDMYGSQFAPLNQTMEWFGRHKTDEKSTAE